MNLGIPELYNHLYLWFNWHFFFQQIAELKKENFNLKLRIYFLDERMNTKFKDADVFKTVSYMVFYVTWVN